MVRRFAFERFVTAAYSFVLLEIMKRDNWNDMSFIYLGACSELLYCHVSAAKTLIATRLFLLKLIYHPYFPHVFVFPQKHITCMNWNVNFSFIFFSAWIQPIYGSLLIHVANFFRMNLDVAVQSNKIWKKIRKEDSPILHV